MIPSVPFSFYFLFWIRNSLAAIGLGIILGHFAFVFLVFTLGPILKSTEWLENCSTLIKFLISPFVALLLTQIFIYKHFYGRNRGNFEYAYRERLLSKEGNALIKKEIGEGQFGRLFFEELSDFSHSREDIYKELLKRAQVRGDNALKFCIYLRMARSSIKHFNFAKGTEWLTMALAIRPDDLMANFRLAIALEKGGDGHGAIRRYRTILSVCPILDFRTFQG
ncbi:MAG: hypothetical protein HXY45_02470 [Syntrophaceae bacterium]|nr:hypothetical protein [Syntrophaceae bacterium]